LTVLDPTSPVCDILEKEEFTLQELMEEDELLQEIKAMNQKLLEL
jgi:PHD/YefM family antitoxin component YafN of YafNO toxin-antitoxin module